MAGRTAEVVTGGAVLAIAVGFFIYAGQISGLASESRGADDYWASFRAVDGVSVGTDVRVAGVKVGTVTEIDLNPKTYRADTHFTVTHGLALPADTAAVISSEGLLGGAYVELLPGGSPSNLKPGSEIVDTQGSVSLINLLLKFVSGGGSGSKGTGG